MNDTKTVALTGKDTIILNDRILSDLADETVAELTFPNAIGDVKVGKNGNSIYAANATGKMSELKLRVIRGSSDDIFLNNLVTQFMANPAGFVLMTGEVVKQVGDGAGNIKSDSYIQSGGIPTKIPDVKSNVGGDVDQAVTHYTFKFSNSPRIIA